MDDKIINLNHVNMKETLRYLGYGSNEPDSNVEELLLLCERELLEVARPDFVYKVFDIDDDFELENCDFNLEGRDIREHLKGCHSAIFLCVTLSAGVDRLIKIKQVNDMAKAVVIDAMACALVEQACDIALEKIYERMKDSYFTQRYGLGYGDFPIENQKRFLNVLDAQKKIGVCVLDSHLLTPTKSITCVVGVSNKKIEKNMDKCDNCKLNGNCRFRRIGVNCEYTGNV